MSEQRKQKRLAWYVWWLSVIALSMGLIVQSVFSDCLPCCPAIVGSSCPGDLIGEWPVCCTKYQSSPYGKVHVGCCDYIKFKIACRGGGTNTYYVLEQRYFNTIGSIWRCISTQTTGRCRLFHTAGK